VALRLNPKGYAHITHSAKTEGENVSFTC